jgi:PAS domain-containing protein
MGSGQGVLRDGHESVPIEGVASDITAHKRAEEGLAAARQQLEAHLDNSPLALIELDWGNRGRTPIVIPQYSSTSKKRWRQPNSHLANRLGQHSIDFTVGVTFQTLLLSLGHRRASLGER